jgi:hypothetical protein
MLRFGESFLWLGERHEQKTSSVSGVSATDETSKDWMGLQEQKLPLLLESVKHELVCEARGKAMKLMVCSSFVVLILSAGCRQTDPPPVNRYQRFVLVEAEQPVQGCKELIVTPCATVVLALDTKTGQVCRSATMHGMNYPLCLRLFEEYPDDKAEVERLKEQIKVDASSDWNAHSQRSLPPCPSNDPLGLAVSKPCQPLPPKK